MKIQLMVLDLSHYDIPIDYNLLRSNGILGVIYKASQGSGNVDATYAVERPKALEAGMLWGAYHFGDSSSPYDQARNFLQSAAVDPESLFCLDYEELSGSNTMDIDQAIAFISEVEKELGRPNQCVLYSGNLIKEDLAKDQDLESFFGQRRLWLAQYSANPVWPACWEAPWLWQYSGDGQGMLPQLKGPSGYYDCNSFAGTPEELKAQWASGTPVAPPETLGEVVITINAPANIKVTIHQNGVIIS